MRPVRGAAPVALAALALGAAGCGADENAGARAATLAPATTQPPPAARAAGLPRRVPGTGTLTAYVRRDKVLRARPGGRGLVRLARRTRWDSPRVLAVVRRRGPWLAVLAPELRNGQVGWIDARRHVELFRTPWSLRADLSRRLLVVRRGGRVVRRVRVAIGRPSAPTPRGLFAVTDRLRTGRELGPYGCCVLALTGHQPRLPQGWGGGDRLAIHATPAEQTIGQAASLGCLRATNAQMRWLLREVPIGARVRIVA